MCWQHNLACLVRWAGGASRAAPLAVVGWSSVLAVIGVGVAVLEGLAEHDEEDREGS